MRLCVMLLLMMTVAESSSLVGWLWSKSEEEPTEVVVTDGLPLIAIPYEAMTDDEKFLQEAAKVTHIQVSSPLETCQHKVVLKIRTSCSEMSEEQLAKLSVNLLNCQSAVEGRKMFPCTEDMSLKQCTTDMDADTWNAYHLMSNRARAVCYAARSTQFRALTELTVNKLMQSARSQVDALSSLKESHERLQDTTVEALTSLAAGNKVLLDQQRSLQDAQSSAHRLVASNLRELYNEKALIRSGHLQLSAMTEDIKKRLEKTSSQMLSQAAESQENHRELLDDLINIQQQAHDIWEKIESSTNRIITQNAEAAAQYEQTLQKLEQINDTIHFIWNVTESMRTEIDNKLGWIAEYIGNTGEKLQQVYQISLHISYLLAAMVISAFLNAPFLTRATIMALIPVNLATYLKHGMNACLDFTSLTFLIFVITGMYFVMVGIQRMIGSRAKNPKGDCGAERVNQATVNGHLSTVTSTPRAKTSVAVGTRLINVLDDVYNFLAQQLARARDNTVKLAQAAGTLCRSNSIPVEELSCSYGPSKRSREELYNDYGRTYHMDDETELEVTRSDFEGDDKFDEMDNIVDANDLRQRVNAFRVSKSNYAVQESVQRSISPNPVLSVRTLCSAYTKSGTKCRSRAQQGRYFCGRHSLGSSILGD